MRKAISFLKETYAELKKVVWPTRRRTLRLTIIVIVVTVLFSGFLAAVDYGLGEGLEYVIDNQQKQGQPADNAGQPGALPQGIPGAEQPAAPQPQQPSQ